MPDPTFTITRDPNKTGLQINNGIRSDTITYTIRVDNGEPATDNQALSALIAAYPINTMHTDYALMMVSNWRLTGVESPNTLWTGEVIYTTPAFGFNPPTADTLAGLLALPPQIESLTPDFYQEPCEVDKFGKPIINSAGDPYDPAGTSDETRIILVLSKYKQSYVASTYSPFFGKLNNAAYTVPGLGSCAVRTLRCISIRPAAGFIAVIDIPIGSVTGTFTTGETVTWAGGGSASIVSVASGRMRVMNPTVSVPNSTTLTGGTSGSTVSSSAAVTLPAVKVLWVFEYRPKGFDQENLDKGTRGWWWDADENLSLGHVFVKKDHTEVGAHVPLYGGSPADHTAYDVNNPKFDAWVVNDALQERIDDGEVEEREVLVEMSGGPDVTLVFHKFKRIGDVSFSGIGL